MGLDDFLKNMDEASDRLDFQKAYYEEIKKSSEKLNTVKSELYKEIKTNELCKKTAEFYNDLSFKWKKWLACSVLTFALSIQLYSFMHPYFDGNSLTKSEEKKVETSTSNTQMADGEEALSFSSNTKSSPSVSSSSSESYSSTNEQESFPVEKNEKQNYEKLMPKSDYVYFPVRGDSLSKIARDVTGNMDNWRTILRYNRLDKSDIKNIEVNQPIIIPEKLAKEKGNLFDGVLVRESENFDGVHAPYKYVQARNGEDLKDISKRVYGESGLSNKIFSYNRELNPRFSRTIYEKEYIFLPPDTYFEK